jgi:sugar transferase (PEP-CTERM/EpsH1 system associated)
MQLLQIAYKAQTSSPPLPGVSSATRLRILHVVSCLGMGGTEHGVLKIIRGLGHAEFEHQICAVRGVDDNFVRQMNVPAQISAVGLAEPGFQFPLFRLMHLMKKFRPHIVHTRNFGALEAIAAARFVGVPVAIHSEHGYELEILGGLPFRRRLVCRALYTMADQVCTVTRDLMDYHSKQSWLSPRKFRVIYNGVDTDLFSPRPDLAAVLRSEIGVPMGRVVIGSVGRLVPIKDYKTLLQAAEILVRQGKEVHVLLVGSGPELPKLQSYAAASTELAGRVLFLPASNRIADLLNSMDVFVLPSISEGMSNTILEAMATGLPVVVSCAGGNPELVDDGSVGGLFDPRDVEALARHLSRLVDNSALRREYGRAARQRAVDQFSLSGMVQHYRETYVDLASIRGVWKGN